mgnify:CR=1 FL=1
MLNIKEDHHLFPRGAYHVILAPRIYYSFSSFYIFVQSHQKTKTCIVSFWKKILQRVLASCYFCTDRNNLVTLGIQVTQFLDLLFESTLVLVLSTENKTELTNW